MAHDGRHRAPGSFLSTRRAGRRRALFRDRRADLVRQGRDSFCYRSRNLRGRPGPDRLARARRRGRRGHRRRGITTLAAARDRDVQATSAQAEFCDRERHGSWPRSAARDLSGSARLSRCAAIARGNSRERTYALRGCHTGRLLRWIFFRTNTSTAAFMPISLSCAARPPFCRASRRSCGSGGRRTFAYGCARRHCGSNAIWWQSSANADPSSATPRAAS